MTKVIQSGTTGMFLTANGEWTKDLRAARRFGDFTQAAALAERLGLTRVLFYFSFDDYGPTEWDFALPLRGHPCAGPQPRPPLT